MKPLLSYKILAFTTVLLYCSSVKAQFAADPNAVDLSAGMRVLDTTSLPSEFYLPFQIADINNDSKEDLMLQLLATDSNSMSRIYYSETILTTDGLLQPILTDLDRVTFMADVDGDGRVDAVTAKDDSLGRTYVVRKALGNAHYAPEQVILRHKEDDPLLITDVNGDGNPDVISRGTLSHKIYLYLGHAGSIEFTQPDDSVDLSESTAFSYIQKATVGHFTPDGHATLLIASSSQLNEQWTWEFVVTGIPLGSSGKTFGKAQRVFVDTIPNQYVFVYTAPLAIGDISGDGLDDLMIADSAHVYITNGSARFTTETRNPANADFTIVSPGLLDAAHDPIETLTSLTFAGNLAGTGVPYLALSGYSASPSLYIYAGGAALDTYYDGIASLPGGRTEFLSIEVGGSQTALIGTRMRNGISELTLIHDGTGNLPHTPRSNVTTDPRHDVVVKWLDANNIEVSNLNLPPGTLTARLLDVIGRSVCSAEYSWDGISPLRLSFAPHQTGTFFLNLRGLTQNSLIIPLR